MHLLTDDDLYWTFATPLRGWRATRLNDLKRGCERARAAAIGELIAAIRRGGLEVVGFHNVEPGHSTSTDPDRNAAILRLIEQGRANERDARDILAALCRLTDARPDHLRQPRLPLRLPEGPC